MDLSERLKDVVQVMRDTKESWVSTNPENTDLMIYLHFWRGDEMVATVMCPLDRDTALQAGRLCAAGFNADTMSITFESYHSTHEKNPVTGESWMPREMQFTFETNPEAREKEWVIECVTTTIHERGGGFGLHSQPYKILDGKVEWAGGEKTWDSTKDDAAGGDGYMYTALQQCMEDPKMSEVIAQAALNDSPEALAAQMVGASLTEEQQLFHTDMATHSILIERDLVVGIFLTAEEGSERQKMLEERLGEQAQVQ